MGSKSSQTIQKFRFNATVEIYHNNKTVLYKTPKDSVITSFWCIRICMLEGGSGVVK